MTTSICVFADTTRSNRTEYPTVSPTFSFKIDAMRVAAARAATRLGSKTKIFPPSEVDENQRFPAREHIIASGSAVVFPAPGGACKIKSSRSFSSSLKRTRKQSLTTSLIGNCAICSLTRSFSKSFSSSHFPLPIGYSGVVKRLPLLDVGELLFLLRCVFPLS